MSKKPDEIAASLLARILRGEFDGDATLPREDDLVSDYGVAKATVREARRALQERGMVRVVHGVAGAQLRPPTEWDLFDPLLLDATLAGPEAAAVLGEAIECRRLLEPEAAALASARAEEKDLAALASALDRMRAGGKSDPRSFSALEGRRVAELDFLGGVLRAARNRFLSRALLPLGAAMAALLPPQAGARRAVTEYDAVLAAIRAHDSEAARAAMQARIETLARAVRRSRRS